MKTTEVHSSPDLPRDEYGALRLVSILTAEQRQQTDDLLIRAIKAGSIPEPFIVSSKKELECLNLDVYDILLYRKRVKALVVQARTFRKHLRKGFTRASKTYYLLLANGKLVDVQELENRTCAKRAKNTTALGQLVRHYTAGIIVPCKSPNSRASTAYKVLARGSDGHLVSAFDNSKYTVGKWRAQAAKGDHGGGFYYYEDRSLALQATQQGLTFASCVSAGKQLILCEVEVAGRRVEYDGGKRAASRLRVLRELEQVVGAPTKVP